MNKESKKFDYFYVNNNRFETIVMIGLVFLLIFMHIFRLADIPYGINVDEMGMGYDSWCLANYGVDRYLKSFPLYLINFSGGQSSLYAYLCIPFIKLFGLNVIVMRIPAMIFGFITAIFGFKLIRDIWPENKFNQILFLFLYTIFPVFTMLHRIGLDCNLSLGMTTMFLFFFNKAIKLERTKYYLVSGILCGLVLYTYALNYFLMPLLLFFVLCYLIFIRKITIRNIITFCIPLFCLALPLVMVQFINILDLKEIKIGIFTLPKLYRYRGEDFSVKSFIKNIPAIWNSLFLYDGVDFNTLPGYYTMYLISIPFAFIGMLKGAYQGIVSVKNRKWDFSVVFFLLLVIEVIIGCILNADGPNTYRLNSVFIALIYFVILGIDFVRGILIKWNAIIVKGFTAAVLITYTVYFISFAHYYFVDYKDDTYLIPLFQHKFEMALEYLNTEVDEKIAVRTTYIGDLNQTYIYYLGSTMISPYEYNKLEIQDSQHLWEWTAKYKNYNFNLPESIDMNANYIIVDTNKDYINKLIEAGFEYVVKDHYYVFIHPWISYDTISTMKYGWDLGVSDNNQIDLTIATSDVQGVPSVVLVGWFFQGATNREWNDIFICVGDMTYRPERAQRQDIVDKIGNSNILNCGMVYVLPADQLMSVDQIEMIALDTENKVKESVVLSIKK